MKKLIFIFFLTLLMLASCKSNDDELFSNTISQNSQVTTDNTLCDDVMIDNESKQSVQDVKTDEKESQDLISQKIISIRSLAQLEEMRQMTICKDETLLKHYLSSVEGGGAQSVNDLSAFVRLVNAIPYVQLKEGEISWIGYYQGMFEDTRKSYEFLYISTTIADDEWFRIEYNLTESNISNVTLNDSYSVLPNTIKSKDGKVEVLAEKRQVDNSASSSTITWITKINGNVAKIIYKTSNSSIISTEDLYNEVCITTVVNNFGSDAK